MQRKSKSKSGSTEGKTEESERDARNGWGSASVERLRTYPLVYRSIDGASAFYVSYLRKSNLRAVRALTALGEMSAGVATGLAAGLLYFNFPPPLIHFYNPSVSLGFLSTTY